MCSQKQNVNLGFTEEGFPAGTHICLIYSSEEERRKIIGRYLNAGLNAGEKVVYIADLSSPLEINEWVSEEDLNSARPVNLNKLDIRNAKETYFPGGIFIPEEMLEKIKDLYEDSILENFPASRISGEMTWATKSIPGSERLMEYESKINDVVEKYPVTAVCQYDASKFYGATLLECLKVHPYLIVHGQVVRNPYYLRSYE
jgi:hypothetical protein